LKEQNAWFVERATKIQCMLQAEHQFPEDIVALLRKNETQSAMCHVQRYGRENSDFDVEDMLITELRHYLTTYTVKLNEWWCDYEEFQAICLPCPYVIAVCSFCHLQLTTFVAPVYSVHNIFKAYEVQFNPVRNQDYWSTYTGPNLLPDPMMHQHQLGRPNTQRIHKEMDDSIPNKPKKCSYCRTEGHN